MILFLPLIAGGAILLALWLRHPRDRRVRGGRDSMRCPRCLYSLDGLPTNARCPECGLAEGERLGWGAREAVRRAEARLATTVCAAAACVASVLAFAVSVRADPGGFIAVALFVPWPFLLAAVLPSLSWRRPWAAFGVALSGSLATLMCSVGLAALLFKSSDPLDGLVLIWFPFLGSGAAALGILFGAVCANLSARENDAKLAAKS